MSAHPLAPQRLKNRDQHDIQQLVTFGSIDPWVFSAFKHALQTLLAYFFHLLSAPSFASITSSNISYDCSI
jgi:hypothetical protein